MGIERRQLHQEAVCLFEVVGHNLLKLALATALLVEALRPVGEALVQLSAPPLEEATVGSVADEPVYKAEAADRPDRVVVALDQALLGERAERVRQRDDQLLVD